MDLFKCVQYTGSNWIVRTVAGRVVADLHHLYADLDLAFHFNTVPDSDPAFHLMRIRIRILLLIEMIRICNHWSADPPGLPLSLHASIVNVRGPLRLNFKPLKLLNLIRRTQIQLPKIMRFWICNPGCRFGCSSVLLNTARRKFYRDSWYLFLAKRYTANKQKSGNLSNLNVWVNMINILCCQYGTIDGKFLYIVHYCTFNVHTTKYCKLYSYLLAHKIIN